MEEKKLIVYPAPWSDAIADILQRAAVHATRAELQQQHQHGARCYAVACDGQVVGAYLLRIDSTARGLEGVVLAAAGHLDGVELIESLLHVIEIQFRQNDCTSIRIHTSRPGIARKLDRAGYRSAEIVLSKKL